MAPSIYDHIFAGDAAETESVSGAGYAVDRDKATRALIERAELPVAALAWISAFYSPLEVAYAGLAPAKPLTRAQVADVLAQISGSVSADEFIASAYRRGFFDIAEGGSLPDGPFGLGTFYGRLDIFATAEFEEWRKLPSEARSALDAWYFDEYMNRLDDDLTQPPTDDTVMTLEDTLAFIDAQDRPVYLNTCDCRSLAGNCEKPTRNCITYRSATNSFAHRGVSEEITKERAKEIVREADAAGLMHTVNANGICNCCDDCCYLFRGQKRRASRGVWPIAPHLISFDRSACINCGKCVKRCPFGVFELKRSETSGRRQLELDTTPCVGCGLCVTTCPTGALALKERTHS